MYLSTESQSGDLKPTITQSVWHLSSSLHDVFLSCVFLIINHSWRIIKPSVKKHKFICLSAKITSITVVLLFRAVHLRLPDTEYQILEIFGYLGPINNLVKTHKYTMYTMYSCMYKITNTNTIFKQKPASLWKAVDKCYFHVMAERFSASDLCSDGWVVRMWVQILAGPWCLCPWARHFTIIASLHPGENGYLWGQSWLLCLISHMRRNGSNWAVYSPGSWDGFRNDLWTWWAGIIIHC